jgi:long-subunit fatty acid transport protein
MKILKNKLLFFLFFYFITASLYAQVNDAGLWTSINIDKKISKKFSISLSEEIRFNENISEMGSIFTDAGINYKINKIIRISGNYRFINKRRIDDSYSQRHRYYFDFSIRTKFQYFTLMFRTRYQSQYKDIYSSPDGKVAENYIRNKLTIKYELDKKWSFYGSFEMFSPLRTYDKILFDNLRYNAGIEYSINKMHSIDLSYLIQKEYNVKNPWTDYVICVGYNFSF